MHSHLFLPSHVTYVHRTLGQLSHHEDRSDALPFCMGHNGEMGRPGFKMLGTDGIDERESLSCCAHQSPGSSETPESSLLAARVDEASSRETACGDIQPTSIHWATLSSRSSEKVSLR